MKRFIFLPVFVLLLIGIAFADDSIRVMTFNIRMNTPSDGVNAWPNRKDNVAEMVDARYKADLVGMQEVLIEQLLDLQERLPQYTSIGVARDDGKKAGEFSPIFYRKDRFSLLEDNTFWLSETPDEAGTSSWNSACNRVCTWGKFKDNQTGHVFYLFNTHLDHRSQPARDEGTKLIWKRMKAITGTSPTIFTGDLNSTENSFPIHFLDGKHDSGSDLKNAKFISKKPALGPVVSFTNWKELRPGNSPIDYIFVRNGFTVLEHHTLDDKFGDFFPSDHLPVMAVLQFPEK
jgi:endonuclease/exonuclease/phosphatase family metal-dependent hydrolase